MIEPEPLQQIGRTYVFWRGHKLSYFSGCDYFRLSSHPKVRHGLSVGLRDFGLNVAASRLTTGNHILYGKLEKRLARFFKTDSALLVSSGYVANLAVAQALAGQFTHAFVDEAAHPSLLDAAKFLECPVRKFKHRSAKQLASRIVQGRRGARMILLTDGMFARDGAVAPLKQYLEVLPLNAILLVDDAHGAGIMGPNGRGTVAHCGVHDSRIIQTITLSKAFGTYGGAILCSGRLRASILARSNLFVGSTPLPLPLAHAALQALTMLETDSKLISRLFRHTRVVKDALKKIGMPLAETPGPIVALKPRRPAAIRNVRSALLRARIYPPFIKYPGGPSSGYFRFVISSEHSQAQLDNLAKALTRVASLLVPFP